MVQEIVRFFLFLQMNVVSLYFKGTDLIWFRFVLFYSIPTIIGLFYAKSCFDMNIEYMIG